MRLPRLSVRTLMVAVALIAALMAALSPTVRERASRRAVHLQEAADFAKLHRHYEALARRAAPSSPQAAQRFRDWAQHAANMRRDSEQAARQPWLFPIQTWEDPRRRR
jgi:hypothetical protein